jgi:ABC-type bacteriocin/lantibiotic exporter with double-glycine peptidase domain
LSTESDGARPADPGLLALVMLLRFHGLGADPEQIRHRFGAGPIDIPEMLRCAKELGLKARSRVTRWERLVSTPLPGIVTLRDGGFLLLAKVGDDKALVQSPLSPRPTKSEFGQGPILLMPIHRANNPVIWRDALCTQRPRDVSSCLGPFAIGDQASVNPP